MRAQRAVNGQDGIKQRYRAFGGGKNTIGIDRAGDWVIDGVQRFAGARRTGRA